jgi:hypothetical protein
MNYIDNFILKIINSLMITFPILTKHNNFKKWELIHNNVQKTKDSKF